MKRKRKYKKNGALVPLLIVGGIGAVGVAAYVVYRNMAAAAKKALQDLSTRRPAAPVTGGLLLSFGPSFPRPPRGGVAETGPVPARESIVIGGNIYDRREIPLVDGSKVTPAQGSSLKFVMPNGANLDFLTVSDDNILHKNNDGTYSVWSDGTAKVDFQYTLDGRAVRGAMIVSPTHIMA